MRSSREKYLLYIGVVVAVLPVIIMRDFTPANELRYLSIADEALRNHTFFAFTNHGAIYADKPPLYIWIIMMCKCLVGKYYMWMLSLFSLIPALGILRVMDNWTKEEMGSESRNLARIMTITGGLYLVCALTIRMDMLMTFFIVLALKEAWKIMQGSTQRDIQVRRLRLSLFVFLAVFTKGPLGFLIPLCSTAVFVFLISNNKNKARLFFHVWNWQVWGAMLLLCAAWFAATYAEGGSAYLNNLLFHQTIGRAVNTFHHNNPFYYYAICIWYCLAPWSLFVIGIFIAALRKKVVKSDLQKFIMTIAATTFVLLSCISSKLQIYMLPAVPFLTYSAAMFMPRFIESTWLKAALAFPAFVLLLSLPAIYITSIIGKVNYLSNGMVYASATVLTLTGGYSLYICCRKSIYSPSRVINHIGVGMLMAVFVAAFAFPEIDKVIGYGDICEAAMEASKKYDITDFRIWRIGKAQNIDVYLKQKVTVMPDDEIPVTETARGYIIVTKSEDVKYFRGKQSKKVGPYAIVFFSN